ncbi:hypothetical protein [Luteimonas deserti]|uniref:Secreted protein n=1 Tax=Luteimonas deserti TaxID=2752306 RepID=A0A7Z0QN78_9GAMM|nr:hypothetical protein [Luteimonas deserti]NYZ61648.1 hypothetical protein [Luteimonas deserti]
MSAMRAWLLVPLVLWLAGCAAPHAPAALPTEAPGITVPHGAPSALAGTPLSPDTRCTRDADCTVKNVGNCCGAYPACVNTAAVVDPEAVAADCARRGIASVCGFQDVTACRCVANRCEAAPMAPLER